MIYEYEIQYDTNNVITGYQYTIPTGNGTSLTRTLAANGTTNDRVNLQDILDEINNQGGGTLVLPNGRDIFINGSNSDWQTLIIYSNITITSEKKTTLVYGDAVASRVLSCKIDNLSDGVVNNEEYYPVSNFTLNNLIIRADDQNTTSPSVALLYLRSNQTEGNEDITISNCEFMGETVTGNNVYMDRISGLAIENCTFQESITSIRITGDETNENITIKGCNFSGGSPISRRIYATGVNSFYLDKSVFSNAGIGTEINGNNNNVCITKNIFEPTLTNNPIRITGSSADEEFTENLWITDNYIGIGRAASEIENTQITRLSDGRAFLNGYDVANKPIGISAINITCAPTETAESHHQNVVVENNIAEGPDYGFFDGGSGDLYSLKDIVRLNCTGNRARNSGDLGFAIERCHFATVSNNTADRNNSCGISIFDSSNVSVVGNVCSDNELTRDGLYSNKPYGGIRVEGESFNILVEGNFFFANSGVSRSSVNDLSDNSLDYNAPGIQTQEYGIVVKHSGDRTSVDDNAGITGDPYQKTPFNVKIGHNHVSTHFWGAIYNKMKSTQIVDTFSGNTVPMNADYPLGARLRNNLTAASTSATKEWYVSHRIELFVTEDVTTLPSSTIKVAARTGIPSNQASFLDEDQNNSNYKYIINDDLTTMLQDDIIGIMLDDYSIHWTKISTVTVNGAVATITLQDALPDTISVRDLQSTDNEVKNRIVKRVMSLRWEAL